MKVLLVQVMSFVRLTVLQLMLRLLFPLTAAKLKVSGTFIHLLSTFVFAFPPLTTCAPAVRHRDIAERNICRTGDFGFSAGPSRGLVFGGH